VKPPSSITGIWLGVGGGGGEEIGALNPFRCVIFTTDALQYFSLFQYEGEICEV